MREASGKASKAKKKSRPYSPVRSIEELQTLTEPSNGNGTSIDDTDVADFHEAGHLAEANSEDLSTVDAMHVDISLDRIREEVHKKKGKNTDSSGSAALPNPSLIAADGHTCSTYKDGKVIQLPPFSAEEKETARQADLLSQTTRLLF